MIGADFTDANLQEANFSGADLTRARLSGSRLASTCFAEATLCGADLRGADVTAADFSVANLSGARVDDVFFRAAEIRGADISEIEHSGNGSPAFDPLGVGIAPNDEAVETQQITGDTNGDSELAAQFVELSGREIGITGVEKIADAESCLRIPMRGAPKGRATHYQVRTHQPIARIAAGDYAPPAQRQKLSYLGTVNTDSWGLAIIDPARPLRADAVPKIIKSGPWVDPTLLRELNLEGSFAEIILPEDMSHPVFGVGKRPFNEIVVVIAWDFDDLADYEVPVDHVVEMLSLEFVSQSNPLFDTPQFTDAVAYAQAMGDAYLKRFVQALESDEAIAWGIDEQAADTRAIRRESTDGDWYRESMAVWSVLADGGNAAALRELGSHKIRANDGEDEAIGLWKKAAQKGDAIAMCELGDLAFRRADAKSARGWFSKAAAAGYAEAADKLARIDAGTWDLASEDFREAVLSAQSQGTTKLRTFVAGLGANANFPTDESGRVPAECIDALTALADGGHNAALRELGWIALGDEDELEAARLWKRSASSGDHLAMLDLGFLAKQAGDLNAARSWYRQAQAAGNSDAEDALAELDRET